MIEDQVFGRKRLTIIKANEGDRRAALGRVDAAIEAGEVVARRRRNEIARAVVTSWEPSPADSKTIKVRVEGGDLWVLTGCGCGGG